MRCALCHKEGTLKESHIIPEFLYQALYDEIHRFHVLSKEPNERNRKFQKGIRERLLCDECEQRIGRYERYISLLLRGGIELECQSEGRLVIVRNIDYRAVRMFQLSILWRASISSHPFFEQVRLGPHAERLRLQLLADDVGVPWQYGCLVYALMHEGEQQEDLIMQPVWIKLDGLRGYRFIFGGFAWVFIVANHQTSNRIETASLDPSGELRILKTDLMSMPSLLDFGRELFMQGKLKFKKPE